ncbi:MAG: COG1470 family protein [Candidatus Methanogasteraceae archaeon]
MELRRGLMPILPIVLLLWCSLVAGDCCVEETWICEGVHHIDLSGRAVIGDYTIKLRDIDNNSAVLVLYHRTQFKDIYTMTDGDTETYFDQFRITALQIENESATVEAYRYGKESVWAKECTDRLKIGENISAGDYLIHIIDFENRTVALCIYTNGTHLASDRFDVGESRIYDEKLKVHLRYLEDEHCTIEAYLRLSTDLVMRIDMLNVYQPDQVIQCSVNIQNTGLPIRNVVLEVVADEQNYTMHYPVIDSNDTFDVAIYPPVLPYQSNLSIVANLTGGIWNGDTYSANCERTVVITPYIIAEKSVAPDELNLSESAMVTTTLKNVGFTDMEVRLTDSLPEGFETGSTTEWTLQLAPNQPQQITYQISPKDAGTFVIPACRAEYGDYAVASHPCRITVHGPSITATKTVLDTLDSHTKKVLIRIGNRGDRAAGVELTDTVPPGIAVISGETGWQGQMLPGEAHNHSYIIQFEDLESLPPATIAVTDGYDYHGIVKSNAVGGAEETAESEDGIETTESESIGNATTTIAETQSRSTTSAMIGSRGLIALLIQIFAVFLCIFLMPIAAGYLILRNQGDSL